jgi:hypothetical protein
MREAVLILALVLGVAHPAKAAPESQKANVNNNKAVGVGVGIGKGGNAKATSKNQNVNQNVNQPKATSSSGAAATVTNNVSAPPAGPGNVSVETTSERQSPTVFAPPLVTAPETCMGSVSGGASYIAGFSFGTTYESENCNRRMDSLRLQSLGFRDAALALMAQKPSVAKALRDAGYSVPGQQIPAAPSELVVESTPTGPITAPQDAFQGP